MKIEKTVENPKPRGGFNSQLIFIIFTNVLKKIVVFYLQTDIWLLLNQKVCGISRMPKDESEQSLLLKHVKNTPVTHF